MRVLRRLISWPVRHYMRPRVDWALARLDAHVKEQTNFIDEAISAVLANQRLLNQQLQEFEPDYQIPPLDRRGIVDLRWSVAEFLNWAASPSGYASQMGLWMNTGVQLAHEAGGVGLLSLNERLVELPFCFQRLAVLPAGARVLDVGGAESTLGYSLAALGYDVTVVDPRGYPLTHANLTAIAKPIEEVDRGSPFDAAVAISTVEHIGLGSYDQRRGSDDADVNAVRTLATLVAPGGLLILTVPFGPPSMDDFQRVYDLAGAHRLLAGWEIETFTVIRRLSPTEWEVCSTDEPPMSEGVAMVAARNRTVA